MLSGRDADRARIAEIDAQIPDLERYISALRVEKALAQHRLESYKYPVLTLPVEIVSEIFVHFLPPYPQCPPFTGIHSPTLLTQICHKWRDIALATAGLWRAVSLTTQGNGIPREEQLQIAEAWLSRSRCPLSLRITEAGLRLAVFALILAHRERWEYLEFDFFGSDPIFIEGMPLLRHLDLSLHSSAAAAFSLRTAPLLRSVILGVDVDGVGIDSNIDLPWAQLKSLTLCSSLTDSFRILRQTSNLVHCRLNVSTEGAHPEKGITLPHLESLALDNPWTQSQETQFLNVNTFITPALQRLEISEQNLASNPIQSLGSFISKSGCQLQELYITGGVNALWVRSVPLPHGRYRAEFPSIRTISVVEPDPWPS
ncbi:hypothetical protein DFH06DRAFT_1474005 [Mycena polygramma]|nr:hypothetical protein DFH06DRAFT_1474005 [Mycena polygramma]